MLNETDFHLPYNPALIGRARELRKNKTSAERKLWYQYLRTFQFKVYRQRSIDYFIVDFYYLSLKLMIKSMEKAIIPMKAKTTIAKELKD